MIKTVMGDITKAADLKKIHGNTANGEAAVGYSAIVNAANSSLLGGGGVDGAIHRAAGPELLFECRMLNGCKTGEAKLTRGYKLPCDYIIHTVGPVWNGGGRNEEALLADCYRNSMKVALEHDIRFIAFPSIATGIYHFPVDLAAKIAVGTVADFLGEHEGKFELVEWVLFDQRTYEVYQREVEHEFGRYQ